MVMNIFTLVPKNYKNISRSPKNIYRLAKYFIARAFGSEDYVPFLIISRSRTGSTLLMTSLNSHPNIMCLGERLNFLRRNEKSRKRNPASIIKNFYSKQPRYTKAAGFKLFYSHPNDASESEREAIWAQLAAIDNLKIVNLRRENVLRALISKELAAQSGEYFSTNKSNGSKSSKKIEFKPEKLHEELDKNEHRQKTCLDRFNHCKKLEITYEQLVSNPSETHQALCDFLNVDQVSLSSDLKKQNPEPIKEILTNYTELEEYFSGTAYSSFFKE